MLKKINRLNKRCISVINGSFFAICLLAYSVLMLILFYNQTCAHNGEWFLSDMEAYLLTMLGKDSGFDYPYPIYFLLGKFFLLFTDIEWAGAWATMIMNSLSPIVLAYYMHKTLKEHYEKCVYKEWMGILTTVFTFSLLFVSMLYAPEGIYLPGMNHKYLGVFSPNPLHNATYMATRPFAIVAFFLYIRILDYYEERTDWKEFSLFGLFLLLTTLTKPSYSMLLVSTAGLVMAYRVFLSKWKNIRYSLKLGAVFVPTFVVLLYQFGGVFGKNSHAGENGGIGFGWADAWSVHMDNIPFAIVLALAFPGFLLLFNLKELKCNTLYRFSWFQVIIALLELLIIYEKEEERFIHMNFSWGYMHGLFFVFVASLILLVQKTIETITEKKHNVLALVLFWLAYGWHLICGIYFFLYIWSGQSYYCF